MDCLRIPGLDFCTIKDQASTRIGMPPFILIEQKLILIAGACFNQPQCDILCNEAKPG
jgi:hypothetical protein